MGDFTKRLLQKDKRAWLDQLAGVREELWGGRPFESITVPVKDGGQAERRARVDALVSAIERCLPNEPAKRERLEWARESLLGFVMADCAPPPLRTMPTDVWASLPPLEQRAVYWNEMDETADWARAQVVKLAQARVLASATVNDDPVAAVLHLRQLAELVAWAGFYQYGQTMAYNLLAKKADDVRDKFLICKELEDLIRGAVAIGDRRLAAALEAVGVDGDPELLEGQVDEIETTIAKQFGVVRFVAKNMENLDGEGLVQHVDRLQAAYRWACGFVHVTPQLLLWSDAASADRLRQEAGFTVATAVLSSLIVLSRLVLRDEIADVRFGPIFARPSSVVRGMVRFALPELDMLLAKNKKVAFTMNDGQVIVAYDPNARTSNRGTGS